MSDVTKFEIVDLDEWGRDDESALVYYDEPHWWAQASPRKVPWADTLAEAIDNWRKGGKAVIPRYIGAALRHILAYQTGERLDPESDGNPHLAHALTSLAFALELEAEDGC